MRHPAPWILILALAIFSAVVVAAMADSPRPVSVAGATPPARLSSEAPKHRGPVNDENQKSGSQNWKSPELARGRGQPLDEESSEGRRKERQAGAAGRAPVDTRTPVANDSAWVDTVIRGYAGATSVNHGQPIILYVSTAQPTFDIEIYREGWYGGAGGRLITAARGLQGQNQPVPTADPDTGLIAANWQPSFTVQTAADWVSGVYLAKLIAANGSSGYIIFVVRADETPADIVFQLPLNTYSAYNNWGGKSLYDFNSTGSIPAVKVSYDRPYAVWSGAGSFFDGDYNMVRWLESQGYNLSYIASTDLESGPDRLAGSTVFLSDFHDEYWSKGMRDAVTGARDGGVNLAFFDANDIYWQIRFESSASGVPNRVIVCYKDASTDPIATTNPALTTVTWREAPVNQPENALLGGMFESYYPYGTAYDWVVQSANHWIYSGTGLQNGQTISGLVGYEYDKVWNNGLTPSGTVTLSNSPVIDLNGIHSTSNSTIYTAASTALVFNAGTIYWPWKLDDNDFQSHGSDPRVQQMTTNLLEAMITGTPPTYITPPPPTPSSGLTVYDESLAPGWSNSSWSSTVNFTNTSPVYTGSKSIAFVVTGAYGALSLTASSPVDTTPYDVLRFALQASQPGQRYAVALTDPAGTAIGSPLILDGRVGGEPIVGAWKYYRIDLIALNAADLPVGGIIIQDDNGRAQPALYVDDLGFSAASVSPKSSPTPGPKAAIVGPSPGTTLSGASVPFTWTTAASADIYSLWVGSIAGGYNLFYTYCLCTSTTATGLPTDGSTVYLRLWTHVAATGWNFADYTYSAFR